MGETAPLLEYIFTGGSTWGSRAFANGKVEVYSDQEVSFDKDFEFTKIPLAWRPQGQLSAEGLAQLTEALRASDFFALPPKIEPPGRVFEASSATWRASLDGRSHQVHAYGIEQTRHPTLEGLRRTFEDLIDAALDANAAPNT